MIKIALRPRIPSILPHNSPAQYPHASRHFHTSHQSIHYFSNRKTPQTPQTHRLHRVRRPTHHPRSRATRKKRNHRTHPPWQQRKNPRPRQRKPTFTPIHQHPRPHQKQRATTLHRILPKSQPRQRHRTRQSTRNRSTPPILRLHDGTIQHGRCHRRR